MITIDQELRREGQNLVFVAYPPEVGSVYLFSPAHALACGWRKIRVLSSCPLTPTLSPEGERETRVYLRSLRLGTYLKHARTAAFRLHQRPNDGSVPSSLKRSVDRRRCFRTPRGICPPASLGH